MTRPDNGLHLGVDVGGTFTDLVVVGDGRVRVGKVPTRVGEPFAAISEGLEQIGVGIGEISVMAFGTTIATNILIERTGAQTALLCTRGFTDVLDHQRWHRRHLYDLQQTRPAPLVRRALRVGLDERTLADGEVLSDVDAQEVLSAVAALREQGIESVAVCLLNSYANPHNEQEIGALINAADPDLYVSLSSAISPLIREWERTSTAVINAYVQPSMDTHLRELNSEAQAASPDLRLYVMQSSGGVISVDQAAAEPVRTILSGPAAGVLGGVSIGESVGNPDLILMDMGGTSCDVAVVLDGAAPLSKQGEADYNLPVSVPMFDIKTIGAGGGSLVTIDSGGALKVGPDSAGAVPGPACYSRGGDRATVTDAQLFLGRLPSDGLLGGQMALDTAASERVLAEVAAPLHLSTERLAAGVIRIADANMAEAIRMITVNRGLDPRDFVLVPFGGAGPLHACEIANELELDKILIPASAGVLSACGLASAAVRVGAIKALNTSIDALAERLEAEFEELERRADALLAEHDVPEEDRMLRRSADMRYRYQSFEITVPVEGQASAELGDAFHAAHDRLYHYSRPDEVPFLVNIEVIAEGRRRAPALSEVEASAQPCAPTGTRKMFVLDSSEWTDAEVYRRDALRAGHRVEGPAVIDQLDSTVVVLPGFSAEVDRFGTMILTREETR
jgi:N-methylhydantoinase A